MDRGTGMESRRTGEHPRPFRREGLLVRTAPFGGAMALALLAWLLPGAEKDDGALVTAAWLTALIAAAVVLAPWEKLPDFAQAVPPLAYFLVIAILREGEGGASSSYAPLVMLPIFWLALYGRRRELAVAVAGAGVVFVTPLLLPEFDYPQSEWRRALLWIAIGSIVGFTVQRLVRQVRREVLESERRAEALRRSEERARAIVESAGEAFISTTADGLIVEWNRKAEETFGWSRGEAVGRRLSETVIAPQERERYERSHEELAETGEGIPVGTWIESVALHRDGHEFPVELSISPIRLGKTYALNAFVRDITDRKRAERYVGAQHAVTRVLAESATLRDAVPRLLRALGESLGWHVGTLWTADERAHVLRCGEIWHAPSVAIRRLDALSREITFPPGVGLPGRVWASGETTWLEDLRTNPASPRAAVAAEQGLHGAIGVPLARRGKVFAVMEFLRPRASRPDDDLIEMMGTISSQIGQFIERVERADLLVRLETVARTDDLTGLANRRAWNEELPSELERAGRDGMPICVAIFDLDRFKRFNDSHGHQAGDRLLKEAAAAWRAQLRATDLLSRYGGEEFAVILPTCPMDDALVLIERLRAATPGGQTCSAGVAQWDGWETADALVGRADAALYEAKAAGRDRIVAAA